MKKYTVTVKMTHRLPIEAFNALEALQKAKVTLTYGFGHSMDDPEVMSVEEWKPRVPETDINGVLVVEK